MVDLIGPYTSVQRYTIIKYRITLRGGLVMTIPAIINVLIIKYFVIYFSHVIAYVLHRVLLNAFLSIEAHPNVSSLTITFIKSYEEAMSDKRAVVHYIVSATDCTNHVSDQFV